MNSLFKKMLVVLAVSYYYGVYCDLFAQSVHKKLKKTCDICNEEVPFSSISMHKRKVDTLAKLVPFVPNYSFNRYLLIEIRVGPGIVSLKCVIYYSIY